MSSTPNPATNPQQNGRSKTPLLPTLLWWERGRNLYECKLCGRNGTTDASHRKWCDKCKLLMRQQQAQNYEMRM